MRRERGSGTTPSEYARSHGTLHITNGGVRGKEKATKARIKRNAESFLAFRKKLAEQKGSNPEKK